MSGNKNSGRKKEEPSERVVVMIKKDRVDKLVNKHGQSVQNVIRFLIEKDIESITDHYDMGFLIGNERS